MAKAKKSEAKTEAAEAAEVEQADVPAAPTSANPIRDRVRELRRVRAGDLIPNEKNYRLHPEHQQAAMRGALAEIGYADALLARELPDGRLALCDGHLRQSLDADAIVPVLILDITEAEADKLLLTFDPLSALAEIDTVQLDLLLRDVQQSTSPTQDAALTDLIADLAAEGGIAEESERLTESEASEDNPRLAAFIEARQKSRAAGNDKAEVNFWLCLTFQSHAQKLSFLSQIPDVPTLYGMYVDGEAFARRVGLPVAPLPAATSKPITSPLDKRLSQMTLGAVPAADASNPV